MYLNFTKKDTLHTTFWAGWIPILSPPGVGHLAIGARLTYDLAKGGWPIFASWAGPLRSGASWKVWWHPTFYGIPHKELDKLLANLDKIYIFHGEKRMINHGTVKQVYGRFWKWRTPSIIQVISVFFHRDTNGDKGHLNFEKQPYIAWGFIRCPRRPDAVSSKENTYVLSIQSLQGTQRGENSWSTGTLNKC